MQGRTRGRCARPVDSSKERQASASAFAAKKQGRRRRRLFSSPLSVKLQRPAPVVKALEREVCRATAYMRSIPSLFLLARTRRGRFPSVFIASARFPTRFCLPLDLLLRRPPQASRRSPDAFPRLISYGGRHTHACRGDPDAQHPGHALSPRRRLFGRARSGKPPPLPLPPRSRAAAVAASFPLLSP